MPHKMMNPQIAYVLHDNRMSIEARMLYAYLCSFDDGVPPSTYQMIRQLGIGKTRFYRYRNELEAFGLIEVENKITSGGGVAKYSFPDKPVPTAEAEEILITRLINNNNKAMLKDKGIIGENELMQLGKYPSQDKASEVLENHADAVKMLDSDEISNRAEAIRSHDGMDPDSHTKQVESWKEDLSAKVGNAFEASRDANGQPNLNNFALQCNLRGIAVQFANDGELLFTDANQHHKQVRADNLDPKFSRNSEAFKGQKMSKPLKQKQEEIIKSTDQRNHEHSRAHDSQDHGDAHGSENKAR